MSTLDISLYLAAPLVLLGLIIIFLRRSLYKEFPLFFAYILYVPVTAALRISVAQPSAANFRLYWATEAIYGVLGLLVVFEVFRRIFDLTSSSFMWLRWVLPAIVLAILSLSLWQTFYRPLGHGRISRLVGGIYWFDVGVHTLEGIVLLLVVAFTGFFRIAWRKYEFGILTGFGISAFVTMLADLFRFEWGSSYETFFRYGPPIAYVVAAVVWIEAFFRPARPMQGPRMGIDERMAVLDGFKDGLAWVKRFLGWRRETPVMPT